MLGLREVHAQGATRVSIDGRYIITGGADGVVSLFAIKAWPKSAAIWSFNCHEGAVTDLVLADPLALALSCGRDGRILLHENIFDTTKLVSRVICQVTGEVRCLQLDVERRRVYIAGDSLRCLDMAQGRFKIHTIPLIVPFPIVSLAVSPCGRFIAMGSASGELGVVKTPPTAAAIAAPATTNNTTQLIFRAVLSPTAKKDDAARYRMAWCFTEAGGLMLMVPTATEVQVYQLKEDTGAVTAGASPFSSLTGATAGLRMRAIGGLHDRQLTDLHGALVYRVTKNRVACVMTARNGIFIGKVETRNLSLSRHTSEQYNKAVLGESAASVVVVTDVQVNTATGDVAVGLSDGRVSLLRKASPKEWKPTAEKPVKETAETRTNEEEDAKKQEGSTPVKGSDKNLKMGSSRLKNECDKDDFTDDGGDDDGSSVTESSADSTSSSFSNSDASSDSDVAAEDFGKVAVDLERSGSVVHDSDDVADAALAHAEREAERQRARSRFLDDEAEEGSIEDDEDEDDADDPYNHNSSSSSAHRSTGHGQVEEDDDDFYGKGYDENASVEGQVEDGEEDEGDFRHRNTSSSGSGGGHSAQQQQQRLAGRLPAVQDYSFQVCATPAGDEGSCYLAYNSVGYIHCSREATTVHFHDISYPAVRLQLRDTIIMGSLSPVGAGFIVLPAEPSDTQGSVDEAPRLVVFYHAFTPLGAQSEWRVALLPGETVRCMAAGIRYLAVATSHYLRIFSLSGLELAVLSKCQRIVTMVGTSSRKLMSSFKADFDPLAIVTLSGTGELQMEVIDIGARAAALPARTIPLTELPDGSTHQLQWLGWSEDGLLHTADTAGVVRMFTEDWGGSWVPVYDPRTLVDQSYALWIYGVSDNALLAYRYSRDEPSYPAAAASGLSTELVPLFLPLTRTMGEEGRERWDKVLRQQIRSDELKRHSTFYSPTIAKYDELHDHHLLQFFDVALKGQQTTRALELAMLMEIHDRVVKCAQLANNSGYAKLVPKLLALYEMRMASKSKRRCTLPLKEAMVSEKKKDELLRKLLGQILPHDGNKKGKSNESSAAEGSEVSARMAVTAEDNEEGNLKTTATTTQQQQQQGQAPYVSRTSTPQRAVAASTSSPSTVTTVMDAEATPEPTSAFSSSSGSSARRHISFASEIRPASTLAVAASTAPSLSQASSVSTISTDTCASTAALSSASVGPRKVSNPFAKPFSNAAASTAVCEEDTTHTINRAAATTTADASSRAITNLNTTTGSASSTHQTRLHMSAPSNTSLSPKQTSLLGASQLSTPPRTTVVTALSSASSSMATIAPAKQERQHPEGDDAATSLSSLGGTPEDRRVSAGHTADSPVELNSNSSEHPLATLRSFAAPTTATVARTSANTTTIAKPSTTCFVARELPTHMPASGGPVDPFLVDLNAHDKNRSSTASPTTGFGFLMSNTSSSDVHSNNARNTYYTAQQDVPSVSVQSLLDVGYSETAPVVRSDSFGEALRKRYRDDDEAEDELECAPPAAVPKLTL